TDVKLDFLPSWSADGQWIYFTSDRTGPPQLWKMPSTGGEATQVTRGGARESYPAADGGLIYFTRARPEAGIWSIPAAGGPEQPVPELKEYVRVGRAWGVVKDGIYFLSRRDGQSQEVRFFDFANRRVRILATLDKELSWGVPALALS